MLGVGAIMSQLGTSCKESADDNAACQWTGKFHTEVDSQDLGVVIG